MCMSGCSDACRAACSAACGVAACCYDGGYYGGEYLQDVAETGLVEVGGETMLDAAHDAAAAYVAWRYPWSGEGTEPQERISAYIGALSRQLDAARVNTGRGTTPGPPWRAG